MAGDETTMPPGWWESVDAGADALPNGAPAERVLTLHRNGEEPHPPVAALPGFVRAIDMPVPKPTTWLIDSVWPERMFGLFVGDGGAFKSSLAIHVAGAIAGGYEVFDRFSVRQGPVAILSAEDDGDLVLTRLGAFVNGHQWDPTRVLSNVHILACESAMLSDPHWQAHLTREVERIQPAFMVYDPWAELIGGDENSNSDVRPVIKFVRGLAHRTASALAVVHHAGKMGDGKRQLDRIRGASALPSAARVIWFCDYRADGVSVENVKMTRAPKLEPFIIRREIATEPGNKLMWQSARLSFASARDDALERAMMFVCRSLWRWPKNASGKGPKTNDLRKLAVECRKDTADAMAAGLTNQIIDHALARLNREAVISFEEGRQNARYWFLVNPDHPLARAARATSSGMATEGSASATAGQRLPEDAIAGHGRPDDQGDLLDGDVESDDSRTGSRPRKGRR